MYVGTHIYIYIYIYIHTCTRQLRQPEAGRWLFTEEHIVQDII